MNALLLEHRSRIAFLFRYGVTGVAGGITQTAFLYIWVTLLGLERTYLLGLCLGFVLALAITFLLQKYWTFRDRETKRIPHQLFWYSVVALSGLFLNAILLAGARALAEWIRIDFFHGWYLLAQLLIFVIVSLSNFGLNFLLTFRHARQERLWERS